MAEMPKNANLRSECAMALESLSALLRQAGRSTEADALSQNAKMLKEKQ
jgi:hypothetical protein